MHLIWQKLLESWGHKCCKELLVTLPQYKCRVECFDISFHVLLE